MRIFEIAGGARLKPVITSRFKKHFESFIKANKGLIDSLDKFVTFKIDNPTTPHSRKDTAFSGKHLSGMYHEHLVIGKIILIYQIADGQLRLIDCVDHTTLERARYNLVPYLKQLDSRSFASLPKAKNETGLTDADKTKIEHLLYDLAVDDLDILTAALNGKFDALGEWLEMVIDRPAAEIIGLYGEENLKSEISVVLRNLGSA